jgi:hypothetical protein
MDVVTLEIHSLDTTWVEGVATRHATQRRLTSMLGAVNDQPLCVVDQNGDERLYDRGLILLAACDLTVDEDSPVLTCECRYLYRSRDWNDVLTIGRVWMPAFDAFGTPLFPYRDIRSIPPRSGPLDPIRVFRGPMDSQTITVPY